MFSLPNDEQMSNWVGVVERLPDIFSRGSQPKPLFVTVTGGMFTHFAGTCHGPIVFLNIRKRLALRLKVNKNMSLASWEGAH